MEVEGGPLGRAQELRRLRLRLRRRAHAAGLPHVAGCVGAAAVWRREPAAVAVVGGGWPCLVQGVLGGHGCRHGARHGVVKGWLGGGDDHREPPVVEDLLGDAKQGAKQGVELTTNQDTVQGVAVEIGSSVCIKWLPRHGAGSLHLLWLLFSESGAGHSWLALLHKHTVIHTHSSVKGVWCADFGTHVEAQPLTPTMRSCTSDHPG